MKAKFLLLCVGLMSLLTQICRADESIEELKQKADSGNTIFQIVLAQKLHANQQYQEAAKYYRILAEKGKRGAQTNLGIMYSMGTGVPKDMVEAAKWFMMAAESGYPPAMNHLAILYGTGEGISLDYLQAYKWLSLASFMGDEDAEKLQESLSEEMTPNEIAEAKRLAEEWLEKHGESK
jgi:TPR repeat protein